MTLCAFAFYPFRQQVAWVELAEPGFHKLHPGYIAFLNAGTRNPVSVPQMAS